MNPILELLARIRPRPALYIGYESILRLAFFLRGYSCALDEHLALDTHRFLQVFQDWVASRFSVTSSQSWENIILFQCVDEREAMQLFWDLLDKYVASRKAEA